jgi:hypothetical protein
MPGMPNDFNTMPTTGLALALHPSVVGQKTVLAGFGEQEKADHG